MYKVINLIEVVFENVAENHVTKLLSLLVLSSEKVSEVECSEDIIVLEGNEILDKGVEDFLNFDGDVTVLIIIENLTLGSLTLPKVQLRLLKYDNYYDIDFNFDSNRTKDISKATLIKQLHTQVKKLALSCNVTSFFGGVEPASDEDTRYFTNVELGPLFV